MMPLASVLKLFCTVELKESDKVTFMLPRILDAIVEVMVACSLV
jgi:hypothetical protein